MGRASRAAESQEIAALTTASLDELQARYPEDWNATGQALVAAVEAKHAAGAAQFLARARAEAAPWRSRLQQSGANPRVIRAALPLLVRERMAQLAVKQVVEGAAALRMAGKVTRPTDLPSTGVSSTDLPSTDVPSTNIPSTVLRLGRWSGTLIQALLFRRGLERKPVSMGWFRTLWPLVTEKALLMPLVEPRGIYCFYSRPLLAGLARAIEEVDAEGAVEIAAGDGTLARFLNHAGARVKATDDQSWTRAISYRDDVEKLSAADALATYKPKVVICSWPPPGNTFESRVFRTPSVKRYLVLTTRHRFAAGNWPAYDEAAASFSRAVDEDLSRLVLPPEVDPVVLRFDRKGSAPTP